MLQMKNKQTEDELAGSFQRDFVTLEDDLPAAVSWNANVPKDAATLLTDVKHETTDDN
jgi:hypothetical protein